MSGPLMINSRQSPHGVSHSAESSISSLSTKSSSESGSTNSSPFSETKKQFFIEWFRNDPANVVRGGGSPPAADRPPSGIQDLSQGFVDSFETLTKQIDEELKKAKSTGKEADVLKLQLISSIVLDDLTKIDEMEEAFRADTLNSTLLILDGQGRTRDIALTTSVQNAPPNDQGAVPNVQVRVASGGQPSQFAQGRTRDSTLTAPVQDVVPLNDQFALPASQEEVGGQPVQAFQTWRWPPRGLGPCGPGSFFGPGPGHTWGEE